MTQRELARLACRVLAIYFLVQSLSQVQIGVSQLGTTLSSISFGSAWGWQNFWYQLPTILFPMIQILVAIWLWRRAGVVAAWITGHDLQDDPNEPDAIRVRADLDAVHAVVLSSLGVWVLLQVVPEICSEACNFLIGLAVAPKQAFETAGRSVTSHIWIWGAQVALGFWLIFGAGRIVQMLKRFRGSNRAESPAQPR